MSQGANQGAIALVPSDRPILRPSEALRPLRILLITPKGHKEEASSQKALFSMAIGVLVSITPPQHTLELVDELFGDPIDFNQPYDLVGITTRTMNVNRAYAIADQFRQRGIPVVLGGVHVSFNYAEAKPHADAIVCGEAEHLWSQVLQDVADGCLRPRYDASDFPPVNEVPPLHYARIFAASKREQVDARKSIPIYMTRGCPYTCAFCVTPNFTGRLYRIQSPETIRAQIEEAKRVFFKPSRYGKTPWFMFTDENLGVNKQRTWEILEILAECDIKFSSFISINFLEDPKTVDLLVRAGCLMALVGFESVNQATLKAYNKGRTNSAQRYAEIITTCRKAGLNIQGNFMTNPAIDTYEDMQATEDFVRANRLMMPIYSIITPYPGTQLYREYKEKGLIVDEDWDKYTAHNLVVRCDNYDPLEYQLRYLNHFLGMYAWPAIVTRVAFNRNKLVNLVTSILFRRNLQDQIVSVKSGLRRPLQQTRYIAEPVASEREVTAD
ncbi:B12-binding domain-containing radical SAM protein [Candidatus Chloroploca mongolica]|uniref:B12-binding domain-containing radical SAM protein n=1 Tax=Candidatus Chloroploca mongolica TaxID=2528176 RepID=UPI003530D4EF